MEGEISVMAHMKLNGKMAVALLNLNIKRTKFTRGKTAFWDSLLPM